jgi:uncharacterized protein (TIRG00374 family)
MKRRAPSWKIALRLGICALLLLWICQSIFLREGRSALERQGVAWARLSRAEQWQAAWTHGPRELWDNLARVEPAALGISVAMVALTILIGIVRWRMVLGVQGIALPLVRASEISLVAQFFNSFLLGSTGGDLLKAYYAARETHHKKAEAVTTVFVDRLIGLASMLLFASVMMGPNLSLLRDHERLGAVAAFILLMTIGCTVVLAAAFWGGISNVWPRARVWLRRMPMGEHLERSLDACRQFGRARGFLWRAFALSMGINLACVLQVFALARGLGLDIPPLALGVIVPTIYCISALPITPSGLGVRENLFVLMLAVPEIGVEPTKALSLSLLAYAGSLFWSAAGGIVYATLRESQHLAEITRADEAS